jgi:hypothetical protein
MNAPKPSDLMNITTNPIYCILYTYFFFILFIIEKKIKLKTEKGGKEKKENVARDLPSYTYTPVLVSVIAISVHGREQDRSRAALISHVNEAERAAGEQARASLSMATVAQLLFQLRFRPSLPLR